MAGTGLFAEILEGEDYKYYSDGEWKISSSGKSVAIVNPTTRKTQYKVQGTSLNFSNALLCLIFFFLKFHSLWISMGFCCFVGKFRDYALACF